MKLLFLVFGFGVLLFSSCDLDNLDSDGFLNNLANYPSRTYWAMDFGSDRFYQLEAHLFAEGRHSRIWVERGANVNVSTARRVANTFDNTIYPNMMDVFGVRGFYSLGGAIIARDIMELAGWLVDEDGKLNILFLDIKDGNPPGSNNPFTAGYFWTGNFFENDPRDSLLRHSNESSMIYVTANPQRSPGTTGSNVIIAHEMQHLINFVATFVSGRTALMDLWINEGLSGSAEWLVTRTPDQSYVARFNNDPSGMIEKGNNFFVWDNHAENPLAILDDYTTVYLFFQWLRLQAGNNSIYSNILVSSDHDFRAVTRAFDRTIPGMGYDNWGTLLKTWMAANYINASRGPFGYVNDNVLRHIQGRTLSAGITSINLAPGEGVYSLTGTGSTMPTQGTNIRYSGLTGSSPWLSDTATFSGGALLTYNINTDTRGRAESGRTTGVAASIDPISDALARQAIFSSGPFTIGAKEMLRRHGHGETPVLNLSAMQGLSLPIEFVADEQ